MNSLLLVDAIVDPILVPSPQRNFFVSGSELKLSDLVTSIDDFRVQARFELTYL